MKGPTCRHRPLSLPEMTLRNPASDVHDIVCGAKRSLHVLSQGVESVPAYVHSATNVEWF